MWVQPYLYRVTGAPRTVEGDGEQWGHVILRCPFPRSSAQTLFSESEGMSIACPVPGAALGGGSMAVNKRHGFITIFIPEREVIEESNSQR